MEQCVKERIMNAIRQKFIPVISEEEADLMISSKRILGNFKDVSKDVTEQDVLSIMEELGFVYACNEQMEFVWLLGER